MAGGSGLARSMATNDMTYDEAIDDINRVVLVTATGTLTQALGTRAAASRATARALGYSLLFDFSESNNYFSLVEAVDWFGRHYDPVDPGLKHVLAAHVVGEQSEDFFRFLENAWMNRGGNIKVFRDRQAAMQWLLGQRR